MLYYILDNDFQIVAGVDRFQSMIWTEKSYEIGDFELYLPASEETIQLYTTAAEKHFYVIRTEDTNHTNLKNIPAMMIENVKTDIQAKNGKFVIVKGSQLKKLLYRRVALNEKQLAGKIQDELRNLVFNNAISPENFDRAIPRLVLGEEIDGLDDILINYNLKGEYISSIISTACQDKKLGWDIVIDYNRKECKFVLKQGKNRTQNQDGDLSTWNSPVTFSVKNQNLIKTNYEVDYENYRNLAIVKSKYEQYNRTTKEVETIDNDIEVKPYKIDRRPVGIDRYELYIDQGTQTISSKDTIVDVNAQTEQNLTKGRTELDKYAKTISVSADIDTGVTFEYGKDYFLGDLVSIQNEFGQNMEGRITSVTSTLSYNKCQSIPTFVIENYTGKIEDDKEKLDDKDLRVDTNSKYRCVSDGTLRKRATGYKYTTRIVSDGQERRTSDGKGRKLVKSEAFDDSKFSENYV